MLKLLPTKSGLKFLGGLPPKQFRQVMGKVLLLLEDPEPQDSKPLRGCPYRRADAGEYRIIYRMEGDCLVVAAIGKRNDSEVYRHLPR